MRGMWKDIGIATLGILGTLVIVILVMMLIKFGQYPPPLPQLDRLILD